MSTLQDVINLLPRVLGRRYAEPFWVNAANKVLLDIEQKMELPRVKEEFGLVLKERITNYPIPPYVRKVLGVYKVGSPNNDYRTEEVDYRTRGKIIEIPEGFNVSDDILIDNALVKAGSSTTIILSDELTTDVEHRLLVCKDGENQGYTSLIQRFDPIEGAVTENTAYLKRPLPAEPLPGETFSIHESFLIVEYIKGFDRVKDLVCDIVEDDDVLVVIENGLRYYGELQTDEESEYAIRWSNQYRNSLKNYVNSHTRGLFKQKPKFDVNLRTIRSEPSRFFGNNSGVYGDREAQG